MLYRTTFRSKRNHHRCLSSLKKNLISWGTKKDRRKSTRKDVRKRKSPKSFMGNRTDKGKTIEEQKENQQDKGGIGQRKRKVKEKKPEECEGRKQGMEKEKKKDIRKRGIETGQHRQDPTTRGTTRGTCKVREQRKKGRNRVIQ